MARKQTLIHLHGTGRLENAALLNKGEIAVRHAETTVDTELAVKTTVGEQDVLVYIPSFDKVQGMTNAVDTAAKGYATAAQGAAKDYTDAREDVLQGQIDALVSGDTSVAKQIADAKAEIAEDIADAVETAGTTAKGYADAAQAAAIASGQTYTEEYVDDAKEALQAEIDKKVAQTAYDAKIAELAKAISDETTKRDTDDKALTQAIADEKAARETAISGVNTTITNLQTTLNQAIADAEAAANTYTDGKIATEVTRSNKYADDAVAVETAAREAAISGVNTTITTLESTLKTYADTAEADAITASTAYTNTEVGKVNAVLTAHTANTTVHITADERTLWTKAANEFNTFMTSEEIDETVNTLHEIQNWMNGEGVNATELTEAIAIETKNREDADKALGDRIDALVSGDTSVASQIAAALVTAKGYADDAQANAIATGKTYTDAEIDKVEGAINDMDTAYKLADTNLETALKTYADTAEADAIASGKTYTDNAVSGATTELKAYTDKAKGDANTYTDNAVSSATTALQAKIDAKVAQAVYEADMQALGAEDLRLAGLISGNTTAITKEIKDREDAISGVRTDFAAADTAIRGEFAAEDAAIRREFAAADDVVRGEFAAADTALGNRIKAIEDAKPIYNVTVDNTATNKITATKTDNAVVLNFDNMVIDCGEY